MLRSCAYDRCWYLLCPCYGHIKKRIILNLNVAGLSFRSPFVAPFEKREEADKARKAFAAGNRSDHLTLLKAYEGWANAKEKGGERAYCMTHFLSPNAMRMIAQSKRQFVDLLVEIGFLQTSKDVFGPLPSAFNPNGRSSRNRRGQKGKNRPGQLRFGGSWYNTNSKAMPLIKAVICAGLYPNIVRVQPQKPPRPDRDGRPRPPRAPKLLNREGGEVFIHPISCNFDASLTFPSPFLM